MGYGWIRVDADIDQHPDLRRAAPYALDVFLCLLRLVKAHGWRGAVPSAFADPGYLAERMRWEPDRVDAIRAALASLLDIGWIARDGSDTAIPHWSRFQEDPTAAERQAAHRRRSAGAEQLPLGLESNALSRGVTAVTTTGRDGTGRSTLSPPLAPPPSLGSSENTTLSRGNRADVHPLDVKNRSRRGPHVPDAILPLVDRALVAFSEASRVAHHTGDERRGAEATELLADLLPRLITQEGGDEERALRRIARVGAHLRQLWADDARMAAQVHVVTACRHFERFEEQAMAAGVRPDPPPPAAPDPGIQALAAARAACVECSRETGEPCPDHGGTIACADCRRSPSKVCEPHGRERRRVFAEAVRTVVGGPP